MSKKVISFHYTLHDTAGKMHDTSQNREPLMFLEGSGHIIPGLETQLVLLEKGDKKKINVSYQEAYGSYDQTLIFTASKKEFPSEQVKVGDIFQVEQGDRLQIVTVIEVKDDEVILDANHPLAGKELVFDIEIIDKREATPEEIAHGHVHGAGGHHHH